jgi:poly-gamma-glutamate synthesis protein (capsule biosynthesis protein)
MHWGNEYEHTPTKRQEELARFLAEHRVDLVIGHHPHVLQPIRAYPRENLSPMICYFSLGNFLSGQNESPRLLGGMMRVTLKKSIASNAVVVEDAELIPLVTHYERPFSNFKVYPLHTYSEVMAEKHHLRGANKDTSLSYFEQLLKDVFGSESINNITGR